MQDALERWTDRSALLLAPLLRQIRLEPSRPSDRFAPTWQGPRLTPPNAFAEFVEPVGQRPVELECGSRGWIEQSP